MLRLSMYIHQIFTQLAEYMDVDISPVHPGNAAPVIPDFTSQCEHSCFLLECLTLEDFSNRLADFICDFKTGLNQCSIHTSSDHGRICPASQDCLDCINNDRLAGTRFTGEDVQSAVK